MAPIGRAGPDPAGWDCTHEHAHAASLFAAAAARRATSRGSGRATTLGFMS